MSRDLYEVIRDIISRIERPRVYAGDWAGDVARRILRAINEATTDVLDEIVWERQRQDIKWGEQDHPDVDQVLMNRPGGCSEKRMAEQYEIPTASRAKYLCELAAERGETTWGHILVEEVAEAIEAATQESTQLLREELVQVATVAVAWVEAIDRRSLDTNTSHGV